MIGHKKPSAARIILGTLNACYAARIKVSMSVIGTARSMSTLNWCIKLAGTFRRRLSSIFALATSIIPRQTLRERMKGT